MKFSNKSFSALTALPLLDGLIQICEDQQIICLIIYVFKCFEKDRGVLQQLKDSRVQINISTLGFNNTEI